MTFPKDEYTDPNQLKQAQCRGYLPNRLITKWVAAHTDKVYFRGTVQRRINWF
ncbi:MAG TPA: hypothetical protein VIF86_06915 [Methylobacter sp.]|jgi:hypothetical protein